MATPLSGAGAGLVVAGSGRITWIQITGTSFQFFDNKLAASGTKLTLVLTPGVYTFPNGIDYTNGIYATGTGAFIVGIADSAYGGN
jgi:hypothetical protein